MANNLIVVSVCDRSIDLLIECCVMLFVGTLLSLSLTLMLAKRYCCEWLEEYTVGLITEMRIRWRLNGPPLCLLVFGQCTSKCTQSIDQ